MHYGLKREFLERYDDDMHVVIHDYICQQIISFVGEVLDGFHHKGLFLRFQGKQRSEQTPSDEIGRSIQSPVRELSAVYGEIGSFH